jgi:hypothetical protein
MDHAQIGEVLEYAIDVASLSEALEGASEPERKELRYRLKKQIAALTAAVREAGGLREV